MSEAIHVAEIFGERQNKRRVRQSDVLPFWENVFANLAGPVYMRRKNL